MSDDSGASDSDERGGFLIPKPPGEAGRANSGGYNLQEKLGWDEKRFKEFTTYINETSEKLLVPNLCFSKQEPKALEKVFRMTAKEFKIEDAYEKDWLIREAYKLHLKYTLEYAKKKVVRKATTGIKKAASALNIRNPTASTSSRAKYATHDEDL
ncbi:hypothetical protein HYPSUDRAFT_208735 [Hypholoma sublateritium FD-334 SS-4]|uniref:Uncharacterized protein n=1 Tax=Hypholoma sublateritium (strain FD-334 SS-4) TaxID=945553 RepID=A0A0D2LU40_HYPSF|nr:hypothetical protein HYPSUDRAFT_208735 [Hypholoma sublateritium FD-334 SS-4]